MTNTLASLDRSLRAMQREVELGIRFRTEMPVMCAVAVELQKLRSNKVRVVLMEDVDEAADELPEAQPARYFGYELVAGVLVVRLQLDGGQLRRFEGWELMFVEAVQPELPQCAGFEGTGARCASCRIRKAMHA